MPASSMNGLDFVPGLFQNAASRSWSLGRHMRNAEAVLDSIECPSCGETIPISETIYHQVVERAERELKAKSQQQERV
jgi:hypothetical protein